MTIFLVQFGIYQLSYIFQRLKIALTLQAREVWLALEKKLLALINSNCTRNHVIISRLPRKQLLENPKPTIWWELRKIIFSDKRCSNFSADDSK